jgi:hypothetical protein
MNGCGVTILPSGTQGVRLRSARVKENCRLGTRCERASALAAARRLCRGVGNRLCPYCRQRAGETYSPYAPDPGGDTGRQRRACGREPFPLCIRKLDDYGVFLAAKRPVVAASGLADLPALHPGMMPHQRDCVAFGLRQGRWGMFLDTGLGKTLCELEWAKHAAAATNGRRADPGAAGRCRPAQARGGQMGLRKCPSDPRPVAGPGRASTSATTIG